MNANVKKEMSTVIISAIMCFMIICTGIDALAWLIPILGIISGYSLSKIL